ncbi:MAG: hypothetical protein JJU05_17530 [Verrucomicrobia bacterium]|nr:hypothetical protein [Verrucomicrobiota bacterium]MCH8528963.1 hypothetical protein [Kiritimatiellia bacterium]
MYISLRSPFRAFVGLLCVYSALAVSSPVSAQFPAPIRARIYVPPVRGILTEDSQWAQVPSSVEVTTSEGTRSLRLSRNGYSRIFQVPPNGEVLVSRSEEGSRTATPWIQLQLNQGVREALILVEPGTEDENGRVRAKVLDVSASLFESGNTAFHNFLENPVRLTFGEQETTIEPGSHQVLELEPGRMRIFLEEIDGSGGRRYTGAVHVREDSPTLVTIQPNPTSPRRLDVNTFSGMPDEDE